MWEDRELTAAAVNARDARPHMAASRVAWATRIPRQQRQQQQRARARKGGRGGSRRGLSSASWSNTSALAGRGSAWLIWSVFGGKINCFVLFCLAMDKPVAVEMYSCVFDRAERICVVCLWRSGNSDDRRSVFPCPITKPLFKPNAHEWRFLRGIMIGTSRTRRGLVGLKSLFYCLRTM